MRDYSLLTELFPKLDVEALEKTIVEFGIKHDLEFIAQCAHESGKFCRFKENLNYSAQSLLKVWPNRFDENSANEYARNPEKIANKVYADRMGNGNEESGDGWRYCGRGAIQITGKNNYYKIEDCLVSYGVCSEGDVLNDTECLEKSPFAYYSAGAYWKNNSLDNINDFVLLTKRINGGTNGMEERKAILEEVKAIYAVE